MPRRTQNARVMVVRRLPKEAKDRHAMTHGSGGKELRPHQALFRDMIAWIGMLMPWTSSAKNLYSWLFVIT